MTKIIAVLASRLDLGQHFVINKWDVIRRERPDRCSVLPPQEPLTIRLEGNPRPEKTEMLQVRIFTDPEQLRALELSEYHLADQWVDRRLIEMAETRKR